MRIIKTTDTSRTTRRDYTFLHRPRAHRSSVHGCRALLPSFFSIHHEHNVQKVLHTTAQTQTGHITRVVPHTGTVLLYCTEMPFGNLTARTTDGGGTCVAKNDAMIKTLQSKYNRTYWTERWCQCKSNR